MELYDSTSKWSIIVQVIFAKSLTPDTDANYNEVNAIAAMPTVIFTLGGTWPPNNQLERVNQAFVIVKGSSGSGTLKLPAILNSGGWNWPGRQITIVNWSVSGT